MLNLLVSRQYIAVKAKFVADFLIRNRLINSLIGYELIINSTLCYN
ncbi:hypothetical protein yaldo0001_7930 [Yersinia aldovae ATCC 35236]|nr:hypothetical protein yaldo0001_7930 [Yersinia aldovae ATCC 35236]